MVAKIIAWGANREVARKRLLRALRETALFGIASNRDYLITLLEDEVFAAGRATTAFITERSASIERAPRVVDFERAAVAAVLSYRGQAARSAAAAARVSASLLGWNSAGALSTDYRMATGEREQRLTLTVSNGVYRAGDGELRVDVEVLHDDGNCAEIMLDGVAHRVLYQAASDAVTWIALDDRSECHVNRLTNRIADAKAGGDRRVSAPMHGLLREIRVSEGDAVVRGQCLLVLEAMKMQHEVQAGIDGIVISICREAGAQVAAGELILEIEPAPDGDPPR
jgi:geranyl-CoA carboxylase alpha subunit